MNKPKLHTSTPRQWRQLKPAARDMRRDPTEAEERLWSALRGGKLGVRFRRQHAIGRFIADFFCPRIGLVIEVDGPGRLSQKRYDEEWDSEIEARGFRVLRFPNDRVITDLDSVVREITEALGPHPPAPSP